MKKKEKVVVLKIKKRKNKITMMMLKNRIKKNEKRMCLKSVRWNRISKIQSIKIYRR